jgi:hypothetical protein
VSYQWLAIGFVAPFVVATVIYLERMRDDR